MLTTKLRRMLLFTMESLQMLLFPRASLTVENVEKFIARMGENQEGHSTLLFRRACLELASLLHNNKTDTARRMMRLCPELFSNKESFCCSQGEMHVVTRSYNEYSSDVIFLRWFY